MSKQGVESPPAKQSSEIGQVIQGKFSGFLNSLGDLLLDITALEVNTMVVAHIAGNKFLAEEAYEELYEIPLDPKLGNYFRDQGIPDDLDLRGRYCSLRKKLDLECKTLLKLDDVEIAPAPSHPNLEKLLNDPKFLRFLRKLYELKSGLDSDNPNSTEIDLIYAQTIVQLDGDIINRFNEKLFEHPSKEVIMKLHHDAVTAGEQQWRGLLGFMINLLQSMMPSQQGSKNISLFPQNGK